MFFFFFFPLETLTAISDGYQAHITMYIPLFIIVISLLRSTYKQCLHRLDLLATMIG